MPLFVLFYFDHHFFWSVHFIVNHFCYGEYEPDYYAIN